MGSKVHILVGTKKGAFIIDGDTERRGWTLRGPFCDAWPVNHVIADAATATIYAGGGNEWFGPAVWKSEDLGKTWSHSSAGLAYAEGETPIKAVWSIAPNGKGLYAGVEPAGLFRSEDGGATWAHVEGLTDHPTRSGWQPGAGGLILHTIVPHPTHAQRAWVGISAVGVFETRDGGASWEPRNRGVRADFFPDPHPETGQCVHKLAPAAGRPETLYQQNHCGVYRSEDGGEQWTDLTPGLPSQFGFPLVTHPRDPKTFWIIPLNGDDRGRFVPDASAAVWRTHDAGDTWLRGGDGLPQQDAYLSVLREAMARDTRDPVGITFGTKTGQLWHSRDEGASWQRITADLPEIWAVETVDLGG